MLWGECLSGALYWNDFLRLAKECGFNDPRLMTSSPIAIGNKQILERVGAQVEFYSATYRLFKLPALEPDCEDYGQAVIYKGIPAEDNLGCLSGDLKHFLDLDDHHRCHKGKVFTVCGNTYRMIHDTRFAPLFEVQLYLYISHIHTTIPHYTTLYHTIPHNTTRYTRYTRYTLYSSSVTSPNTMESSKDVARICLTPAEARVEQVDRAAKLWCGGFDVAAKRGKEREGRKDGREREGRKDGGRERRKEGFGVAD